TSGSPGRIRSTTKMIIDTPIRVPSANTARRTRYFLIGCRPLDPAPFERGLRPRNPDLGGGSEERASSERRASEGGQSPPPRLGKPDLIPPDDVVDAEVRGRVLAVDLVVPAVVDLLVADRGERGVLLQHLLGLAHHGLALVLIELLLDARGEVVEGLVDPAPVVLGAVLAVPGREDVGRVHQRGDDRADREVEVAGRGLVEPH